MIARLLAAVDKGYTFAGTFISPCERALAEELEKRGLPLVKAIPDSLSMVYRPKGDEPPRVIAGRLLLLSRVAAPGCSRARAWHGINDALARMADLSLYVKFERGALRWSFARP